MTAGVVIGNIIWCPRNITGIGWFFPPGERLLELTPPLPYPVGIKCLFDATSLFPLLN